MRVKSAIYDFLVFSFQPDLTISEISIPDDENLKILSQMTNTVVGVDYICINLTEPSIGNQPKG